MNIPSIIALLIVLFLMSLGDVFSQLTKGYFPPVFFIAFLFLLFFWSGFESDLFAIASFTKESFTIAMAFMITDLATTLSIERICKYKKYVLFSLCSVTIFLGFSLFIANILPLKEYIYASIPSLSGGFYASLMMQQHFQAEGFVNLAFLCIIVYSMQGFFSFPVAKFLSRNIKRENYSKLPSRKKNVLSKFFEKNDSSNLILLRISIICLISFFLHKILGEQIPVFLLCYLFGFAANEVGFLPDNALQRANAQGWMIFILFGFFFAQLSNISVYIFVHTLAIGCMILFGSLLIFLIIGFLLAKVFKISKETGMLFSLSSLFGNSPEYFLKKEKGNVQALMTSYHFVQAVAIFIAGVIMMYR